MAESAWILDGPEIVDYRELIIQKYLGSGGFGEVHLAHYPNPNVTNPVVIKRINQPVSDHARKLFLKEAKLLSGLRHENIVRMYGICNGPFVIILEYVAFDFKPFLNKNIVVNAVDKFLSEISKLPTWDNRFDQFIPVMANDITKALAYLHSLEIAHRDLKPANVLISNQHYCDLQNSQEMQRCISIRPVICKLADFGESRSQMVQTNRINDPATNQGFRGTFSFMAPEILVPQVHLQEKKMSLDDLKRIDIWALGLVFYCLVNPSISFPYEREINCFQDLLMLLQQRRHPSADSKFESKQTTVWSHVQDAFRVCTKFDSSERLNASQVVVVLHANLRTARHAIAEVKAHQWYSTQEGEEVLQRIYTKFQSISQSRQVQMTRNIETHDMSMSFTDKRMNKWEVRFPRDFPRQGASLIKKRWSSVTQSEEEGEFRQPDSFDIQEAVEHMIRQIQACTPRPDDKAREVTRTMPRTKSAYSGSLDEERSQSQAGEVKTHQWYSTQEGQEALQWIYTKFQSISQSHQVQMTRNTENHDMSMSFTDERKKKWEVRFPHDFPRQGASLIEKGYSSVTQSEERDLKQPDRLDVQEAVDRMLRQIQCSR